MNETKLQIIKSHALQILKYKKPLNLSYKPFYNGENSGCWYNIFS